MSYKVLLYSISLVIISACSRVSDKYLFVKKLSISNPENSCISITNKSKSSSKFSFTLNDKFFKSVKEMKDEIYAIAGSNKDSLYYYSWKFICNNTYSYASLSKENWTTTSLLYINSLGYGLCGKQAIIMSKIWKEFGYSSRIWGLNGHIVPEVYFNGGWHMLDPAYRIYYLNDSLEIAGVEELMDKPELITHPKKIINNDYYYQLRYKTEFAGLYKSKEDNQIIYDEQFNEEIDEFIIELPPSSTLKFPGIFMADPITINNTHVPYFANCLIKIPPEWEGTLKNSLVLADIKGTGVVKINNVEYNTAELALNNEISNQESFIKDIYIGKHTDTIEIVYYLNPLLSSLQNKNTFKINGENVHSLRVHVKKLPEDQVIGNRLAKQYFFYENARVDLLSKQTIADSICSPKNDTIHSVEEFVTSFTNYCKCKNLTKEETEKSILKLKNTLSQIPVEYNLVLFFDTANCLPKETVYFDIIHATEEELLQAFLNLNGKITKKISRK